MVIKHFPILFKKAAQIPKSVIFGWHIEILFLLNLLRQQLSVKCQWGFVPLSIIVS